LIMEEKVLHNNYDVASHGDYHLFSFKNKHFIYDIESVNIFEIEEDFYTLLKNEDVEFLKDFLKELPDEYFKNKLSIPDRGESEPLTNISLNVAQVCNLSCVYCYAVDGEYGLKGKMRHPIAKKSVDFLIEESKNAKNISITFFGGEPLLNIPVLKETVEYALKKAEENNKRISFSITTNGTKFDKDINAFLNKHKFSVTVSFDGDRETQDANRPFRGGKGSFDKTLPKIQEFLKSRNGNATARATVTNHTTDLKHLKNELKRYGFKRAAATVATVSEYANKERGVKSINIHDEEMQKIFESEDFEALNILNAIKERKNISEFSNSKIFSFLFQLKKKNKKTSFCGAGRKMVGISINGDVYPCHRFVGEAKFKLGNISDFDSDTRKKYSDSYTQKHPVCSKCWAKYHCGGAGCIQDNEVMMGDVNNINTRHCTQLKHQLKHAINIFSKMDEDDMNHTFNKK
ncbi:MAG: 4Fe-4S cluster-binding domain-containing protein, partial [Ignavibacteriae bacterium]|nr:4Fe-4S cluster-binding domain-containing protein [Ignavibacteriota bacterium]